MVNLSLKMLSESFYLLIAVFACFELDLTSSYKDLPTYFPKCYRDVPGLNNCILNATEIVRPFLRKGVPELNVPPISPFYIPEISLEQGTNTVNYKSVLKNVVVTGLDSYKFTAFEFDTEKLFFTSVVEMGFLNIYGNYTVQGKIVSFPIEGSGILNVNITSSNGTLALQAKMVTRKNSTYLEAEKTVIKLRVTGGVQSDFNGFFDNKVLAQAAENVFRENFDEILNEVTPTISEVFTRISENILFKSFFKVPYDVLYPLSKS